MLLFGWGDSTTARIISHGIHSRIYTLRVLCERRNESSSINVTLAANHTFKACGGVRACGGMRRSVGPPTTTRGW
eukprot:gene12261-biopygen8804